MGERPRYCLAARLLVATLAASMPSAYALEFVPAYLKETLGFSDVVAVVEVRAGTVAERRGLTCGAVYTARITTVVKGDVQPGTDLQFGFALGHQIGSTYLVFLTADGDGHAREREPCLPKPRYFETLEGNGTLPILKIGTEQYRPMVAFPNTRLLPPDRLYKSIVTIDEIAPYGPTPWRVALDDVLKYLKEPTPAAEQGGK